MSRRAVRPLRVLVRAVAVAALVVGTGVPASGATAPAGGAPAPTPASTAAAVPGSPRGTTSSAAAPLVVVMDLSGSMNDDDGSGTVKLDGAKRALLDVVSNQPESAQVGLWTYPAVVGANHRGTTDECSPGGFLDGLGPQRLGDPSDLTATIRTMVADGGTPTGQALRAATDALRANGASAATLLLVSDGESTCAEDACATARSLSEGGFDVTVQAMGFQISDTGRKELECIAEATQGEYYDVKDSADLAKKVADAAVPRLQLDAEVSTSTVPAGGGVRITATVTNPSATTTPDVSVSLVFTGDGGQPLFLAVVPPKVRLGNLPPGQSRTNTWHVSSSGARTGRAEYRVAAWSPPAATALEQSGELTVTDADLGLDAAGPLLSNALAHGGRAVVLGDSYSAGEGAGDYLPADSSEQGLCHRSDLTHGSQLFGPDNTDVLACSGAVMADFFSRQAGRGGTPSQLSQLEALPKQPNVVVMTIGGNDARFADMVRTCFFSGAALGPLPVYDRQSDCTGDEELWKAVNGGLEGLEEDLPRLFEQVDAVVNSDDAVAKRGGTLAPIVVLAYPQALPQALRAQCLLDAGDVVEDVVRLVGPSKDLFPTRADFSKQLGFSAPEVRKLNEVVQDLDTTVGRSVASSARQGVPVYFVGSAQEAVQPNHTTCDTDPYIVPLNASAPYVVGSVDMARTKLGSPDAGRAQEFVHPNAKGYRAMANAVIAWSQGVEVPKERSAPAAVRVATSDASEPSASVVLSADRAGQADSVVVTVRPGQAVEVKVEGLAPGSPVSIVLRSTPRVLASLTADAQGGLSTVVTVPPDTPVGEHHLSAEGMGLDGAYTTALVSPLRVAPERSWWFWPAAGVAAAAALGAAVLALVHRRVARRGTCTPLA